MGRFDTVSGKAMEAVQPPALFRKPTAHTPSQPPPIEGEGEPLLSYDEWLRPPP